jgi:RNA polymerase primary sigma factor
MDGTTVKHMAIDDIIKENLHVVETLAYQYVRKCPEMTVDDFVGEGNMALVMAARKWNPEKKPVFAHYAIYHIRKAMERIMPHGEIKKNLSEKLAAGHPFTHEAVEQAEISDDMHRRLMQLNQRERDVICHYYGVEGKTKLNMREIAELTGYTRERIRQIRKKAERKMRKTIALFILVFISSIIATVNAQNPPEGGAGVHTVIKEHDKKTKAPSLSEKKKKKLDSKPLKERSKFAKTIYLYGVGFSAVDSVVYFTDEQRLDSMVMEKKTKFLEKRATLSEQLANYLTSIGESKYTAAIIYDTNLKKLDKKYIKHAKYYKKNGFTIKPADKSQFSFSR